MRSTGCSRWLGDAAVWESFSRATGRGEQPCQQGDRPAHDQPEIPGTREPTPADARRVPSRWVSTMAAAPDRRMRRAVPHHAPDSETASGRRADLVRCASSGTGIGVAYGATARGVPGPPRPTLAADRGSPGRSSHRNRADARVEPVVPGSHPFRPPVRCGGEPSPTEPHLDRGARAQHAVPRGSPEALSRSANAHHPAQDAFHVERDRPTGDSRPWWDGAPTPRTLAPATPRTGSRGQCRAWSSSAGERAGCGGESATEGVPRGTFGWQPGAGVFPAGPRRLRASP